MNIKLLIISLFTLNMAYAQVQINVVLHPVVSLEVAENEISCIKQGKDILVSLSFKTFIVPTGEVLRFELIHLDGEKVYSLYYNEETFSRILTRQSPHTLIYPKRGTESHLFTLKISNASPSYCHKIQDTIRLTLEPM